MSTLGQRPYRFQVGPLATDTYRETVQSPLFDPDECRRIVATLRDDGWKVAEVTKERGYGSKTDAAIRSASTQMLPELDGWVVRRLVDELARINDETFRFDLWGMPISDAPSVIRYRANEGGHFSPHIDAGPGMATRKLTYVVQLSDPEDYTGGDLVVIDGGHPASKEQGVLTVFPSVLSHVVSPVIVGERYALVGWVHGPTPS
ncbi:2OG-Fe(II) oxygenase [Dermatobacter hominis]|uniref:2OG-Fe(II) oxygenase n=1 Tax=Dermatobacter hominis TaxID=2884263 RepID=UPI001D0FC6CC|nr:2OG-Fe(II) oxygenase [Dermatobacter hominis]UDY33960.1 2OG-Fe(II) oxygenase [Dermatobacter hominis]